AQGESDPAAAAVGQGLLEPGPLAVRDRPLCRAEDEPDETAFTEKRQPAMNAPLAQGAQYPPGLRLPCPLLAAEHGGRRFGALGPVRREELEQRRGPLLDARRRQHELAGAPEAPLLEERCERRPEACEAGFILDRGERRRVISSGEQRRQFGIFAHEA